MATNNYEYTKEYYKKKAIEYLQEKGVEANDNSIKRAINYLRKKNDNKNSERYCKYENDKLFAGIDELERQGLL